MSTARSLHPHARSHRGVRKLRPRSGTSFGRGARYAGALLLGLAFVSLSCGSNDEKDAARECCNCIGKNQCWDFSMCDSTQHCVCGLLGGGCSTDPPCLAIDDACRAEVCSASCSRFF
jgi:hypothetical protein